MKLKEGEGEVRVLWEVSFLSRSPLPLRLEGIRLVIKVCRVMCKL